MRMKFYDKKRRELTQQVEAVIKVGVVDHFKNASPPVSPLKQPGNKMNRTQGSIS